MTDHHLDHRVQKKSDAGMPSGLSYEWTGRWVVTEDLESHKGAELSDATGYLKFSKPVLLRSLVIQFGKDISLIGGRLKGETIWMRVVRARAPTEEVLKTPLIDLIAEHSNSHIALKAVDELFFLTAERVRLISLEVYEAAGTQVGRVFFQGGFCC